MIIPQPDVRSDRRKLQDEQIAAESQLPPPDVEAKAQAAPVEEYLGRRPLAVMGIVENGLVRPLDSQIKLPERSRVIIVTSERA